MLSPSLFIFIKDKILDKSPSHFIDAANRFSNMYTYEQETIITHSLLEASIASFRSALHVTTLYAKRVIDQSYILLSVNKTIVRCQNWVIVDLVHKRAAPKQPPRKTNSSSSYSSSRPVFPRRHLEEAPSSLFPLVSHPLSPISSSFSFSFSFLVQEAETIPTIVTSNRGY